MGGEIGFQSSPGQGSRFWFTLTLEVKNDAQGTSTADNSVLKDLRLLVVSAPSGSSDGLLEAVSGWVDAPDCAINGAQAIAKVLASNQAGKQYQVILVEDAAIGMDPVAFANVLEESPLFDCITLVFIGPLQSMSSEQQLVRAGYSSRLPSPVDKTLLYNALHAARVEATAIVSGSQVARLIDHYPGPRDERRSARILLAEDNDVNRKVVNHILGRRGYVVECAEDGRQALELLASATFDAAIVDMHMPELSGLEVAQQFRMAYTDRVDMPFIVLSANATADAMRRCEEAQIDAYLTKPVEPARLLQALNK